MILIIIPAYNAGKTIGSCLESIFNQTYQDFEVVVVNDGSTDNTIEKIQRFKNLKNQEIKIINQENKGANAARNKGVEECQFLLFCDADIVLRKDCLEKMVNTLEKNPEASYAYSSFKFGWKRFKLWPFDANRLKQMPYIHTTSLIRYEHFPEFDESIKKLQDWDLWLTMLEQGHIGVWIPEILFQVISTKGTMSQWLPSFFYRLPWEWIGIKPKAVASYEQAVEIIKKKHKL